MDNKTENSPSDTVPEEPIDSSAEGEENVSDEAPSEDSPEPITPSLSLEEINQTTGKNYKTLEAAKKGIKETQSFVGKKIDESQYASKEELMALADEAFYARNPEHEPQREIIDALRFKSGQSISEVVEGDTYKTTFEKVSGFDKIQGAKTVLETNPRLASSRDAMGKAQDAIREAKKAMVQGDDVGSARLAAAAEDAATEAVIDAFELGK